ncbi:MAG: SigE family RNA polymerase sigma factor [Dermatophilaceae bacterium]
MDRDAEFTAFVGARSTALLRTAYLLTGTLPDAEDLLQTALAKVYLSWGRVRDRGALDAYARTVITRTHVSVWRRASVRRERPVAEVPERHTDDDLEAVADRDLVWRGLASLGPRQRAVVVLRYYEDLTEPEIAAVLGCSVGTVKSQLHRGLARLRERIPHSDSSVDAIGRIDDPR